MTKMQYKELRRESAEKDVSSAILDLPPVMPSLRQKYPQIDHLVQTQCTFE